MTNYDKYLDKCYKGILLKDIEIKMITKKFITVVQEEPNVLKISSPVWIVGDIHG